MEKSNVRVRNRRIKTQITEEPKFFRIIPASKLEGTSCAHCREGFEISAPWVKGYESKVNSYPLEKGDVYHRDCLRNYVLIVANLEHFFKS
jgi:hypothetical protein